MPWNSITIVHFGLTHLHHWSLLCGILTVSTLVIVVFLLISLGFDSRSLFCRNISMLMQALTREKKCFSQNVSSFRIWMKEERKKNTTMMCCVCVPRFPYEIQLSAAFFCGNPKMYHLICHSIRFGSKEMTAPHRKYYTASKQSRSNANTTEFRNETENNNTSEKSKARAKTQHITIFLVCK